MIKMGVFYLWGEKEEAFPSRLFFYFLFLFLLSYRISTSRNDKAGGGWGSLSRAAGQWHEGRFLHLGLGPEAGGHAL